MTCIEVRFVFVILAWFHDSIVDDDDEYYRGGRSGLSSCSIGKQKKCSFLFWQSVAVVEVVVIEEEVVVAEEDMAVHMSETNEVSVIIGVHDMSLKVCTFCLLLDLQFSDECSLKVISVNKALW